MAITQAPSFGNAYDLLRRIQATPVRPEPRKFPFPTVINRRDVTCNDCGRSYTNTRRKVCFCSQYLDHK